MDNSASPLTCSGAYAFGGKTEMHMMWSSGLSLAAKLLAKSSETPRMVRRYFMIAIHPGEILREEYMAPLGLTASTLALELRIPASRVHEIINEKRGISVDTALRLAKFFETDLNLWVNLQAQYEADSMDAQKRTDMERIVPYSALQGANLVRV